MRKIEKLLHRYRRRTKAAVRLIAHEINCDPRIVLEVFDWAPSPYFTSPEHARTMREKYARYARIADLTKHLALELECLDETEKYIFDGEIFLNTQLLRRSSRRLANMVAAFESAPLNRSTSGGKNWAASDTAFAIAEVYRRIGRPITFGHFEGTPTTNFGRSVQAAFAAFKISANWRVPAHRAWQQYQGDPNYFHLVFGRPPEE